MTLNSLTVKHTLNRYEHFEMPFILAKEDLKLAEDYPNNASTDLIEVLKDSIVEGMQQNTSLYAVVFHTLAKVKAL